MTGFTGRRLHRLGISIQNFPKALKYREVGGREWISGKACFFNGNQYWQDQSKNYQQSLIYFNNTGNTFAKG